MRVIVASKNPVKIAAAQSGLTQMFPDQSFDVVGVSVPSDVPDQPMSCAEARTGAQNRTRNAQAAEPEADMWIGMEGGVEFRDDDSLQSFAWIVVQTPEHSGEAKTGIFMLPSKVAALIKQGLELGDADDQVFGKSNSKQQNGAVGLLSNNVIVRETYYSHAVVLALISIKNADLYADV